MRLLQSLRRNPWVVVYAAAGLAMMANLLADAYQRAVDVCDLYPHFAFGETLREELAMHHTRLPLVRVHVPTLQLLAAYAAAYLALHVGLLERLWLLLNDLTSGRWLYSLFFERLPACLPFLFSEPGVPELLSEAEDSSEGDYDADVEPLGDQQPVDEQQCNEALAKLVQVKMQHANRTISRPDDWLVFDPEREDLVLQKHKHKLKHKHNGQSNGCRAEAKLSLAREQEPIVDDNQQPSPVGATHKQQPPSKTPSSQQQQQQQDDSLESADSRHR